MQSVSWEAANVSRLHRHFLLAPARPEQMVEVVSKVGGLQAQVQGAAELALSARTAGVTQSDVLEALWRGRTLVRTYGWRGTVHLFAAADLPTWCAAQRFLEEWNDRRWPAGAGIDRERGEALTAAVGEALEESQFGLTRNDLALAVERRIGSWAAPLLRSQWGEALAAAATEGLLCFGPPARGRSVFVHPRKWLGFWREVDPFDAATEACRRYLSACGPVRRADVARWFRIKPEHAQALLERLVPELTEVRLVRKDGSRGEPGWMRAEDVPVAAECGDKMTINLLPQYDAYILGAGQRDWVQPEAMRRRVYADTKGRLEGATGVSVLLADGALAGMWWRKAGSGKPRGRLGLRVEPFVNLSRRQLELLDAEVARVGRFLGQEVAFELAGAQG